MPEFAHEPSRVPEDLGRYFVQRASDCDVEGLVALYEPDAVLALPGGATARGADAIRAAYHDLLAHRSDFPIIEQHPAIVLGDVALTSTRTPSAATAEVARRQSDGSWLWILDRPDVTA